MTDDKLNSAAAQAGVKARMMRRYHEIPNDQVVKIVMDDREHGLLEAEKMILKEQLDDERIEVVWE